MVACNKTCQQIFFAMTIAAGCCFLTTGCAPGAKNEVIVMGMIHGRHRTSKLYSVARVKSFMRAVDPDFILCEIPPDRLETALREFDETGKIDEPRVKRFPEYVEAMFPLHREMHFEIVPCAAWTKAMSDDRREKLARFKETRPEDWAEMNRAESQADEQLRKERLDEDPLGIHTERYDEITARGLEPYNRLFNDALGAGGWDNINAAHYALITASLDGHKGEGKRFLITFGAGHKRWFLDKLRQRDDITLRNLREFSSQGSARETD